VSRDVVPVRLSDAEREQIASAALRQGLTFSAFLRQAALQTSAIVAGKVSVKPREREARERVKVPTILADDPPPRVEEPWRPHHFLDGECVGFGLDVDDVRGRDFPCEPVRSPRREAASVTVIDDSGPASEPLRPKRREFG
jgi:hypothetical protein